MPNTEPPQNITSKPARPAEQPPEAALQSQAEGFGKWLLANQGTLPEDFELDV